MDSLNSLGALKNDKPLCDYDDGITYKVSNIRKINTKYGWYLVVEVDDNRTYLPKRYADVSEETLKKLKKDAEEGCLFFKIIERKEIRGKIYPVLTFVEAME